MEKVQQLKNNNKLIFDKISSTFNSSYYPCMYGKLSFTKNMMYAGIYKDLELNSIKTLANDLEEMSKQLKIQDSKEERIYNTFIAIFDIDDTKISFDNIWYKIIIQLHNLDKKEWKKNSTKDLNNADFKFSFNSKLWYPVLITPSHPNKIRKSKITILSFQPDQTFLLNQEIDNKYYQNIRKKIHKKIDKIYDNKKPHYLSDKSTGKGMVQFLGYDFEEDEKFKYPNIIK
ncbi:MAG: YqcI/YcgG family protein [Campylobacterota bacterium]|nr:YqcI/YcgG family protein [Campylobacterota bacterium]